MGKEGTMNIEIKFRVWDGNKMRGDQYACDILYRIKRNPKGTDYDHYTLMQYTGRKAKGDKEVYQGDVLRSFDGKDARICVVYWDDETSAFRVKYEPHDYDAPLYVFESVTDEMEVIGNEFENPYLLG